MKIKPIRFLIIALLMTFSIFWQGAQVPDFENAPRQVTVGPYLCPSPVVRGGYRIAEIDGVKYHHHWSRAFGFWTIGHSCPRSHHGQILAIEWIEFQEKRLVTAVTHPDTGVAIEWYNRQLDYLKESAASLTGVYACRVAVMYLALLLLFKTVWRSKNKNPAKP